jgi:hypothetical protein
MKTSFFIISITLISLALITTSSAVSGEIDELDHTGSHWIMSKGHKMYDDPQAAEKASERGAYTVEELFIDLMKDEEDLKEVQKWNLAGNSIGNHGALKITQLAEKMINLEELNLSSNQMGEEILVEFAPLLLRTKFKYLNVVRNNGAGSIDAVTALASKLDELIPNDSMELHKAKLNVCLSKIIWIPNNKIETPSMLGGIPTASIKAHKKYYKSH